MGGSSRPFPGSHGRLAADVRDAVGSVPHQAVVFEIVALLFRRTAVGGFGAYPVCDASIRCFPLKEPRDAAGGRDGQRQRGSRNRGKDWASSGTDEEGGWVPVLQQRRSCGSNRSRKFA